MIGVIGMIEESKDGLTIIKSTTEKPKIWRSEFDGKPIVEYEAWVSTEDVDRDGEVILASGWRKESLRNPKFLLFHDDWKLPIGKPYWTRIKEEDGRKGLYSKGRFGPQLDGLAVGELYLQGDMDSFSVGFRWFKRMFDDQADGVKDPWFTYSDQELYEYSAVNIPANPEATIAYEKMIKEAMDIKDIMAIIKSAIKQMNEAQPIINRESYTIKSYEARIGKLESRIAILEKQEITEFNASEYEGDENIDQDTVLVETDLLDGDGNTSDEQDSSGAVLIEVGDSADVVLIENINDLVLTEE